VKLEKRFDFFQQFGIAGAGFAQKRRAIAFRSIEGFQKEIFGALVR